MKLVPGLGGLTLWNKYTISVVLPTYKEKKSIAGVIKAFEALKICDEILVINNNAEIGTSEAIRETSAREIFEKEQGYGAAIKRGLKESIGDLVVICEPDATFDPKDLLKLLPFTDRGEAVYGSRTVDNFIWTGANMGLFLKWGNWFVAKVIELGFNTTYLSDVGCTFRVLKRSFLTEIELEKFTNDGRFGMELLLASAMSRKSIVQVPINYLPRVGESGYTGNLTGAFRLGIRMIFLLGKRRVMNSRDFYEN